MASSREEKMRPYTLCLTEKWYNIRFPINEFQNKQIMIMYIEVNLYAATL